MSYSQRSKPNTAPTLTESVYWGRKTEEDPRHNRGMDHYHEVMNAIGKGHSGSHRSKPCYLSSISDLYICEGEMFHVSSDI